ncbi:PREDICTED: tumor necrosis factor ligand superfamily member 6 [Crocodylus porosus]|uniref:tumor necrosis factor ligand superfamily member 6 n=1 Tax=Crocodylus porosus TaxID=8502 RepID=UPI0009405AEE|nr:PREDICTED: tumor necrosis factor ligand superfamily member 6 [Crocodylus porosus]
MMSWYSHVYEYKNDFSDENDDGLNQNKAAPDPWYSSKASSFFFTSLEKALALLALLALAGAGLGLFQIVQLQKELAELREATSPGHLPPAAEKHTGLPNATEKIVEKKEVRKAVHLTGKSGQKGLPLEWEAIYGHAFTSSIQYKQGSLMINETGLYFVYSSVFFRGEFCNNQPLDHTVYKRNPGYLGNQVLMEDRRMNYCATQKMWAGNSYLGALFNLTRMDRLYVNVSKIALVHFEESKTFFGVFKL